MTTAPHWQNFGVTLFHGDAIEVMHELPEASVDAVVCDPPYNLSESGKRDTNCLRRVIVDVFFPNNDDGDTQIGESGHLATPAGFGPKLSGVSRPVGVDAGIGVPEGSVDLKCATIPEQEINHRDESPPGAANRNLTLGDNTKEQKSLGDYVLRPTDGWNPPFCNGTCSCFSEPSSGVISVPVALARTAGGDLPSDLISGWRGRDTNVRPSDNPGGESETAPAIVAGAGAILSAVLRLDLTRGTGELIPADDADIRDPHLQLVSTLDIGTGSGTSSLPAMSKPTRISVVDETTDGTFTLHLPVHMANLTGRARGFMGRDWDGWVSPASFQRWCRAWAVEAFRVLKPGGHLLAFGGTRTVHRLTCGIEDAGFEIRDTITWLYGSGFPKSLDVSKAIDRQRHDDPNRQAVGAWLRAQREAAGLLQKEVARHWPSATGGLTGCVANWEGGFNCPTWEQWLKLRELIGFGDDMDAEVWRLNGRKGTPGEAWSQREVIGERTTGIGTGRGSVAYISDSGNRNLTAPSTDDARRWQGWGTALKPASEPIVVARKPLAGTVAQTVLQHGTGALNIDGCRVVATEKWPSSADPSSAANGYGPGDADGWSGNWTKRSGSHDAGRWPANVVLSHVMGWDGTDVCAGPDGCVRGCPVAEMDAQSGVLASGANPTRRGSDKFRDAYGEFAGQREITRARGADAGGASRFFPVFRYEAKAPGSERPRADEVAHPTVKPLELMRWLVRLVTPPDGTVLDPFAGSGTTGEACVIEGFDCTLIELEAPHLSLIIKRLSKGIQPVLKM